MALKQTFYQLVLLPAAVVGMFNSSHAFSLRRKDGSPYSPNAFQGWELEAPVPSAEKAWKWATNVRSLAARLTCDSVHPPHGMWANCHIFLVLQNWAENWQFLLLPVQSPGVSHSGKEKQDSWRSGLTNPLFFQSPSHKTKRQQQELIAELRRRQVKDNRHVYEGKDGAIEDIITGNHLLFCNLRGPFTKDKNVYLPSRYYKCFMCFLKNHYLSLGECLYDVKQA